MKLKRFDPPVRAGVAAAVAASVILLGCGAQSSSEGTQRAPENSQSTEQTFSMQQVGSCDDFTLYVDRETGVEYLVYDKWIVLGDRHVFGIIPRYNPDGTLHTGGK